MNSPFRNRDEYEGTEPVAGQHSLLHPRFRQAARRPVVSARDLYRVSRQRHVQGDQVEDNIAYELQEPLNSLDDRLLQQPYEDRESKALRGQSRPLIAPRLSRHFGPAAFLQVQDSSRHQECLPHRGDGMLCENLATEPDTNLEVNPYAFDVPNPSHNPNQLTFDPGHFFQEPSSDTQLGVPSSPAFKAGQRRAETVHTSSDQFMARSHHQKEEETYKDDLVQTRFAVEPRRYNGGQGDILETEYSRTELPDAQYSHSNPVVTGCSRSYAPIVQGIQQVPVTDLPDRLRTIFPYPIFNAVQSKCFHSIYHTDSNFLLSSPTGSGKTVVLELAICRAMTKAATNQYKIVYQAPTKALCSERHRDWQKKFGPLGLSCVELTGDSEAANLRGVKSASIIVTTPEKWDSITRKWTIHEDLMSLISLFLIDEVQLLKEDRGAILEAVVARMKSIGTDVRFVALSATIPNSHDIAAWLGKSPTEPYEPALQEKFDEQFRPVKLQKHVCGYQASTNDFAFEKYLDTKLPDVVRNYSDGRPIMIFCFTRNSTITTAKLLANWWIANHPKDRAWKPPSKIPSFQNKELRECAASGVAFHHAGIDSGDRVNVEKAYLEGELSVICCTSTLAVGVNLPCHLVIIKNTVGFTQNGAVEYSDLEIIQMLGRAGRPQFDDSAVAVIMTRQTKVRKYELMVTGQEVIESTLHVALIDHLNAEIGLGTIRDFDSAQKWFRNTFLYVRIKQHPEYYNLEGTKSEKSIDQHLHDISIRDITLLRQHNLITGELSFRCTEYGYAMAQYYLQFNTMQIFMGLAPKATISEILSAIAQASEFKDIRFRSGEKSLYKSLNKSPFIRFPIPVNLDSPAHKVSLLIQSILGAADISWHGEHAKHKGQYNTEAMIIFKQINRLIRCIIDCQIYTGDSVSINNALIVERSLSARVWDDSPLQMKQIETLGVIGCRKLARAGIRSIEELECTETHRIEQLLGRNPPYGLNIVEKLKAFPKLRASLQLLSHSVTKTAEGVRVLVKIDMGFMNETVPETLAGKAVYVCLLLETSDGRKLHFSRLSARKIGTGQSLIIPALLLTPNLIINCYIMCDGIAGTMRTASITPKIPPPMFSPSMSGSTIRQEPPHSISNISKRRTDTPPNALDGSGLKDEFGDGGIDDDELVQALFNDPEFDHIDNFANKPDEYTEGNTARRNRPGPSELPGRVSQGPRQLANGRWACNHACKDKNACKHLCCKQGIDRPPKKVISKRVASSGTPNGLKTRISQNFHDEGESSQTKFPLTAMKRRNPVVVEELDLTEQTKRKKASHAAGEPAGFGEPHKLDRSIQKKASSYTVSELTHMVPSYYYGKCGEPEATSLGQNQPTNRPSSNVSSDYGHSGPEDITKNIAKLDSIYANIKEANAQIEGKSDHGIGFLRSDTEADRSHARAIGAAHPENLGMSIKFPDRIQHKLSTYSHDEYDLAELEDDLELDNDSVHKHDENSVQRSSTSSVVDIPLLPPEQCQYLFLNDTSSLHASQSDSKPASSVLVSCESEELECGSGNNYEMTGKSNKNSCKRSSSEMITVESSMEEDSRAEKDPEKLLPDEYKDLEPWLYQEFGNIVEITN